MNDSIERKRRKIKLLKQLCIRSSTFQNEKVTIHLKSSLRTKEISTLTVVLLVFLLRLSALISTDSPLLYCYLTYITSSSIYTGEKVNILILPEFLVG